MAVLGTLLHEAVHGLAQTRGVRDTSRCGRSTTTGSNSSPRSSAWSASRPRRSAGPAPRCPAATAATAATYAGVLAELERALGRWRVAEQAAGGPQQGPQPAGLLVRLPAPHPIARRTLEEAPILCGACEEAFQPDEVDDEGGG